MSKLDIDSFYSRSLMFLKIAEIASKTPESENEYYHVGDFQNAITYNVFTAFELFLKFTILSATSDDEHNSIKLSHNLDNLYKIYRDKYPDEKYKLQIPIYYTDDSPIEGLNDDKKYEINKYKFDQILKYPFDNKYENWEMYLSTKCEYSYIEETSKTFKIIFSLIKEKKYDINI